MMLVVALVLTTLTYAQPTGIWLKQASFMGGEDIKTIGYIPGNAATGAAVWTFAEGNESSGPGGSITSEWHLTAYKGTDGSTLFDHQAEGIEVNKIVYDITHDEVVVLFNFSEHGAFAVVGPNTIVPPGISDPGCFYAGMLRYNRAGVLQGTQWFAFPCGFPAAGVAYWDIDMPRERVALCMPVYGDLDADTATFSFGSNSRLLRSDSVYVGIFEWNFSGAAQRFLMFDQPFESTDRSYVTGMAYGSNGDIGLAGNLRSPIRMGSFNLAKASGDSTATFMARLRADGSIPIAKKVFSSATLNSGPLALIYNRTNQHFYFANDWSGQLVVNGTPVQKGTTAYSSNILVAETDSNLTIGHFNSVRYGDTTSGMLGPRLFSYNNLHADNAGNLVLGASIKDSFRIEQRVFRNSTGNTRYKTGIIRFNKDLQLDTCFISSGTGDEHLTTLAMGPDNEIYAGGRFSGQTAFPPLQTTVESSFEDAFILKLKLQKKTTTGIPGIHPSLAGAIYPNPASDRLHIVFEQMQRVSVYTADGRVVYDRLLPPGVAMHTIDVSGLVRGLYFIRVALTDGASHSTGFVKQ